MIRVALLVGLVLLSDVPARGSDETPTSAAARQHFEEKIAPLLAARCLECHSGPTPKGGLNLARRNSARQGGESGTAIVPGKPDESLFWQRIAANEMPPEHPLNAGERELLRGWLADGAPWGAGDLDPLRYSSDHRAGYDWWALQPLPAITPPHVADGWARGDIDRFIEDRLAQAGLKPSPPAEPRVLIRRIYFDLIGLPPDPAEVARFAADPSDAAYAAIVDRLLASPEYGERWGRHWLDVARFGESDGFERNNARTTLWPYRDWVIAALNDDLPYDEFARRQLTGDLIQPDHEGAAAVGFLVAGVHNTVVGSSERMKRLARQDELEEIIAAVGQTFLGLTVNCARCHDHKFDPISTREYYQMISAIDGVKHGEREFSDPEVAAQLAAVSTQLSQQQATLEAFDAEVRERILAERRRQPAAEPDTIERPRPIASWEFEHDLRDSVGPLHGEAFGGARLEGGSLVLDGREAYVRTAPLQRDLQEKTLEAWVLLDNLAQQGGGVISVETNSGEVFDAIVYGEREAGKWMAGSNVFSRTQSFQGIAETQAAQEPVHIAIAYHQDGTITAYRHGRPYGQPYQTGFQTFAKQDAHVVFGLRHLPVGGNRMLAARILRANLYDRALDAAAIAASAGVENSYVSEAALVKFLSPEQRHQREQQTAAVAELRRVRGELEKQHKTKLYTVTASQPEPMRIHVRGGVTEFGEIVAPGGIQALAAPGADFQLPADAPEAERRRKLAAWITGPENPLFARVMVNRVWHYHFGAGLVETPNDLGFNGGLPSHPELLDWLSREFRTHDYRLKWLHRELVLSATYRQSSAPRDEARRIDGNNRLMWRYSPRRVEGEVLRDAILHVSGVLNRERGGPGFQDVSIIYNNGTTYYEPLELADDSAYRRTVYRFTPRGGTSPVLDAFDCPDPSATAPRRSVTTTPLQALSLLHNALVLRVSDHFAERVTREAPDHLDAQVQRAWQLALARAPDEEEQRWSKSLAAQYGLPALCRALFNANEFVVID